MFPKRFATGIRNTTIANPAEFHRSRGDATVFEGNVTEYNFKKQFENFTKLQAILQANGTELGPIAAAEFTGYYGYSYNAKPCKQIRFTTCSKDGSLMWEKYAANSSAGNQNDVYVGGKKMHLTEFLNKSECEQRALLGGVPSIIALVSNN